MAVYDLRINTGTDEDMAALLRRKGVTFLHTTLRKAGSGRSIRAMADDDAVAALEADGYDIERLGNLTERAPRSLAQVGRGNRYRKG